MTEGDHCSVSSVRHNESWSQEKYFILSSSVAGCGQSSEGSQGGGGGGGTQLKCKHYRTGGDIRLSQQGDSPDTRWGEETEMLIKHDVMKIL